MSAGTKRLVRLGSAVVVIGLLFVWAAPAGGQPRYAAAIVLNPTSSPPGTTVTVTGSG